MEENYYICHYCIDYMTTSKCDMRKHFKRKIKCNCLTTLLYEDAKVLTLNKGYNFNFNKNKLLTNDIIFIITHFTNKHNEINENYKNEIYKKNELLNNKLDKKELNESELDKFDLDKIDLDEKEFNKKELSESELHKIKFDKIYYNKEKECYICNNCLTEFTRKFNLVKHLNNKKSCLYKQNIKKLVKEDEEKSLIFLQKEMKEKNKYKEDIIQNIQNIGTQNIQNIGTLNNNNNNTQNNNYNFAIRDFVNDRYDISHIKDSFYEKKDFFLYPNFLQMIMENEKNRNMFIVDKEAIFYTENELNKMSSDKAGYMILDKLSESFDQLLYRQNQEARDYYSFISKYYYIVKGQYKHDTVYKDYDIKEKQFVYTANSRAFRSRDKHLSKITSTLNKFDKETRDVINKSGYQIKSIPLINPNIEDYASVKMRYRDLKDDKW